MRRALAFAALLPLVAQAGGSSDSGTEHLFEFTRSGHAAIAEREIFLPGGAEPLRLVVERSNEGIGISLWQSWAPGRYRLRWRSEKSKGSEALPVSEISLGADRALWLDVFEDSPDEELHQVRLFVLAPDGLRQVLAGAYRVLHSEEDAGRAPRPALCLSRHRPGWRLRDRAAGWPEIVLRSEEKRILLRGPTGPVEAVIGAVDTAFLPADGRYAPTQEKSIHFLVPLAAAAQSLSPAPAPGGGPAAAPSSVRFSLPPNSAVQGLRLVPGCAGSEADWKSNAKISAFSVRFDDGPAISIDRRSKPGAEVFGMEDYAFPGKSYAVQTLVLWPRPIPCRIATITVDAAEPGPDGRSGGCPLEATILGIAED